MDTNEKPTELFHRKMRHTVRWLKQKYGFRSLAEICEFADEDPKFIGNMLYRAKRRYLQGPPIFRFYKFCRVFGLSLEYYSNFSLPVKSNFLDDRSPNLFTLQTNYRATEDPKYLHMAAGFVLGAMTQHCNARMATQNTFALISLSSGPKTGITYIINSDKNLRLMMSHTYTEYNEAQGHSLLTDAYLTSLCEQLKQDRNE